MPIIDFHNHYYPPAYLDALRRARATSGSRSTRKGIRCSTIPATTTSPCAGHRDIAYRETVLDEHGIDTQLITLTSPGTQIESPERAADLAKLVNDALARSSATREPLRRAGHAAAQRPERLGRPSSTAHAAN